MPIRKVESRGLPAGGFLRLIARLGNYWREEYTG